MELPRLANSNGHTVHTQIYTRSSSGGDGGGLRGVMPENQFPERAQKAGGHYPSFSLFSTVAFQGGFGPRALLTKAADYNDYGILVSKFSGKLAFTPCL